MNTEDLKQYLESKYTLVCFDDLAWECVNIISMIQIKDLYNNL